ncbi:MAG: response regulator [Prochlorothrix sp.]|nr:response regulator [Prochlorothrix sp.]
MLYPPRELRRIQQEVIPQFHKNRVWRGEAIAQRKDGSLFYQGLSLTLAADNSIICVCQNISDRKAAEMQLKKSNAQLERATRLKDEFLANMSHELRTPLNAILGLTEVLQEQLYGTLNHQQMQMLQTIDQSGVHLLDLINDILDLAKIESGKMQLSYTLTNLESLCCESVVFVQQDLLDKEIYLEMHIPPNLPYMYLDQRRIRQALINLLSNAVKFTPVAGRVSLAITLHSPAEPAAAQLPLSGPEPPVGVFSPSPPPSLRVTVSDTGIGIAADAIGSLFESFVQVDSALSRQYSGTGLGLALVKKIVELHGGQVGVQSRLGEGSQFWFDLPYRGAEVPTVPGISPSPAPSSAVSPLAIASPSDSPAVVSSPGVSSPGVSSQAVSPLASPTQTPPFPPNLSPSIGHSAAPFDPQRPAQPPLLLLAEDNLANLKTIGNYLQMKGYRLLIAEDGQAALDLLQEHQPALIITDVQLPKVDGLSVIKTLRSNPTFQNTPTIALTALAMAGDRERCLAAGATQYLSKPVRLSQLHQLIQHLLKAKPDHDESAR